MTEKEARLDAMFEELVPVQGKADSLAGEIVRAVTRIQYRHWNDGDRIGIGYGKETCNPAARFLLNKANDPMKAVVKAMWGCYNDTVYEELTALLIGHAVDFIDSHPELRQMETADMWSYKNVNEDVDYSDDSDDDWDFDEVG